MKYFFILISLFLTGLIFSQKKTVVYGTIYDKKTKQSMPFVNVGVLGSSLGAPSNIEGKYKISGYLKSDTLVAKYIGYYEKKIYFKKGITQKINIYLEPSNIVIKEVRVKYKGNPAHILLKKIQKSKANNNKRKYNSYRYNVYNKIQIDLANITDEMINRKRYKKFKFIFNNIDTSKGNKKLPVFITESMTKTFFIKFPRLKKELIVANKMSGFENKSLIRYTSNLNNDINIYDNNIIFFGKGFLSPIGAGAKIAYKYYLEDSLIVNDRKLYKLEFKPKNSSAMLFKGVMFIDKETYAIKQIKGKIGKEANINFIEDVEFSQEFDLIDGKNWMLSKEIVSINFTVETMKFLNNVLIKKTSIFSDIEVNKLKLEDIPEIRGNIQMSDSITNKTDNFWKKNRPENLSEKEKNIYTSIEKLKKNKTFILYKEAAKTFATGRIDFGKFAIGSVYQLYSFNKIEGSRFNIGIRTTKKLFDKTQFLGRLAYGTRDQTFKYGFRIKHRLSKSPFRVLELRVNKDMRRLSSLQPQVRLFQNINFDNFFASVFARNPLNKLILSEEYQLKAEVAIGGKLNLFPTIKYSKVFPRGEVSLYNSRLNKNIEKITTFEVGGTVKMSFSENFVYGNFRRRTLGSRKPIFTLLYLAGIPNVLESNYSYQKAILDIYDKNELGPFGYVRWYLSVGKIWGTLPYVLLKIFSSNNTFIYARNTFALMNISEFVSDEFITFKADHHFDGLFFNRVPLLKKIGLRSYVEGRLAFGSLNKKHSKEAKFLPIIRNFNNTPYIEVGGGIENILQVFRVGVNWRVTHTNQINEKHSNFGVNVGIFIKI